MPTDIYHSQYTRDRHGEKITTEVTDTHEEHGNTEVNSETKAEVKHYEGDADGC